MIMTFVDKIVKLAKNRSGFSLVEVLVYLAILTLVLNVMIGSLVLMAQMQERVVAGKVLDRSANLAIDRITREIKKSEGLDMSGSVFQDPDGVLLLEQADEGDVEFYLSGDNSLYMEKDGVTRRLTHSDVSLESFYIEEVAAGETQAVRVRLFFRAPYSDGSIDQRFYTTAILKDSYE